MALLPEDITKDILTRLPVKSLLRSRSVSKSFLVLIDSPDFIKCHLNHSLNTKTNHKLVVQDSILYSVDLYALDQGLQVYHPLSSEYSRTEIVGSVNGLLCLLYGKEDIVIWNFATRKYQKVPHPGPPDYSYLQFANFGFGYDSVSDDYKLVRLAQFSGQDLDSFNSEAKVYSLRSNSWQRIQDFPYYLWDKRCYGVLACGALHWVVSRKPESDTAILIAAFDIFTNDYRLIGQPEFPKKGLHISVGQLEGHLCLLCNYICQRVDVWVMKGYRAKESWSKLFSVSISTFEFVFPLAYSKRGDEIMLVKDHKKLLWYNLKEGKVRMIDLRGCPYYFEPAICVESLVPLRGKAEDYVKKQGGKGTRKKLNKPGKKRDDFLSQGFKLKL